MEPSIFHLSEDLFDFLNQVVTDDRVPGKITEVRLCSEDAEKCGGVNRWILIDGKFIHFIDDFFKMICLCDPRAIKYLEELCMNPLLKTV